MAGCRVGLRSSENDLELGDRLLLVLATVVSVMLFFSKRLILTPHAQELETQHTAAKAAYDASVGALEAQVAGLKVEVERLQEEIAAAERSASAADSEIKVLDGHLKKLMGAAGEEALKQR